MLGIFCATNITNDEAYKGYVRKKMVALGLTVLLGIASADERNIQVSSMATKVAVAVLLVGMYVVLITGDLWRMELRTAMSFLIILFLFSYMAAYRIISKRL